MTTSLLTRREAADRLRASVRSLDRLRSVGSIKTVRVRRAVRITAAEIEQFITKHGVDAVTQQESTNDHN